MRVLTNPRFMLFREEDANIVASDAAGLPIAARNGHPVKSYVELLQKIAALSYHNSRFRLLFRGQRKDYRLNMRAEPGVHSCLFPSILRPVEGPKRELLLDSRFERLARAEGLLQDALRYEEIHRLRIVRWAILQHYEICETPLLDVTLSLQTALSFVFGTNVVTGYLFVFAVPHLTGPVSVSTEAMTQTVDLAHVCPPEALRPHFQSGVLIGDYPEYENRLQTHNKKGFIGNSFACRLLTKFQLLGVGSWKQEGFAPTSTSLLFPNEHDSWYTTLQGVKRALDS